MCVVNEHGPFAQIEPLVHLVGDTQIEKLVLPCETQSRFECRYGLPINVVDVHDNIGTRIVGLQDPAIQLAVKHAPGPATKHAKAPAELPGSLRTQAKPETRQIDGIIENSICEISAVINSRGNSGRCRPSENRP